MRANCPSSAVAALALLLAAGCASRSVSDVWAMPNMAGEASPVSAQFARGYPFSLSGAGTRAGDSADGDPSPREPGASRTTVGDLPESAYAVQPRGFWRYDEEAAIREARERGRGLVVSFWASWCDECRKLDDETWRAPAVRAAIFRDFVPLRVDVSEESIVGRLQLERFGVVRVPTTLVLDPEGRELERMDAFVSDDVLLDKLAAGRRATPP